MTEPIVEETNIEETQQQETVTSESLEVPDVEWTQHIGFAIKADGEEFVLPDYMAKEFTLEKLKDLAIDGGYEGFTIQGDVRFAKSTQETEIMLERC